MCKVSWIHRVGAQIHNHGLVFKNHLHTPILRHFGMQHIVSGFSPHRGCPNSGYSYSVKAINHILRRKGKEKVRWLQILKQFFLMLFCWAKPDEPTHWRVIPNQMRLKCFPHISCFLSNLITSSINCWWRKYRFPSIPSDCCFQNFTIWYKA